MEQYRGTTILSVRRKGRVVVGGDGQVSMGNTVMKGNARKVRTLYHGKVLAGFAGGTADAFTLFERFEACPMAKRWAPAETARHAKISIRRLRRQFTVVRILITCSYGVFKKNRAEPMT